MAERDERHRRMGDSRYLVEPNVKDGKGGLRDLHSLRWIGEHLFGIERTADMVDKGLLSPAELVRFDRAERFFWAVRCHLHLTAGRAEERLGFDYQREIAAAMRYADRPGKSAVERFMQFYFLQAKAVGDLTGIFLAQLDERLAKQGRRFALPTFTRRPRKLDGFLLDRGRLVDPRRAVLRGRSGPRNRDVRACRDGATGNPSQGDAGRAASMLGSSIRFATIRAPMRSSSMC